MIRYEDQTLFISTGTPSNVTGNPIYSENNPQYSSQRDGNMKYNNKL